MPKTVGTSYEGLAGCWGLFGVAALSMLFLPSEARDTMGEQWRLLTGDPGQACFDYQRTLLKDPYSARFDSYLISPANSNEVTVKYHAKNSYGAYGGNEATCAVYGGVVNQSSTTLLRENVILDKRIEKMKAENICLGRLNKAHARRTGTNGSSA